MRISKSDYDNLEQQLRSARDTIKRARRPPDMPDDLGCGDNSCVVRPPSGMATNGGCQCDEMALRRAVMYWRKVATANALQGTSAHDAGAFSCSFCGCNREQCGRLIQGPAISICDVCVAGCAQIFGIDEINRLIREKLTKNDATEPDQIA